MRNLKKFLALVLAMMMTLSLMVTVNAATTYPDQDKAEPKFNEAIDVLSGVGVIKGDDKGNFNPTDNITRAEAAAIMYRIVTGDVDDDRDGLHTGVVNFTDVKDGDWFAGYVGFCADRGIIKGDGDGMFRPHANVTGYEMLAMLLRAVGYGQKNEFTGSGWQIPVGSRATALGILENVNTTIYGGNLRGAARRDVVADLTFQTITKAHQVTMSSLGDYNEYTSLVSNIKNPTLGEKVFKLACMTGIIVGNQSTGETVTKLGVGLTFDKSANGIEGITATSVSYVYATDTATDLDTVKGTNATLSFKTTTGLDKFGHKVDVWYKAGTNDPSKNLTVGTGATVGVNKVEIADVYGTVYCVRDLAGHTAVVCSETLANDENDLSDVDAATDGEYLGGLIKDAGFTYGVGSKVWKNDKFEAMVAGDEVEVKATTSVVDSSTQNVYLAISNGTANDDGDYPLDMVIALDVYVEDVKEVNNYPVAPAAKTFKGGITNTAIDRSGKAGVATNLLVYGHDAIKVGQPVVTNKITGTVTGTTTYWGVDPLTETKTGVVKGKASDGTLTLDDGTKLEKSPLFDMTTTTYNSKNNDTILIGSSKTFLLDENGAYVGIEETAGFYLYGTYAYWTQASYDKVTYTLQGVTLDGQKKDVPITASEYNDLIKDSGIRYLDSGAENRVFVNNGGASTNGDYFRGSLFYVSADGDLYSAQSPSAGALPQPEKVTTGTITQFGTTNARTTVKELGLHTEYTLAAGAWTVKTAGKANTFKADSKEIARTNSAVDTDAGQDDFLMDNTQFHVFTGWGQTLEVKTYTGLKELMGSALSVEAYGVYVAGGIDTEDQSSTNKGVSHVVIEGDISKWVGTSTFLYNHKNTDASTILDKNGNFQLDLRVAGEKDETPYLVGSIINKSGTNTTAGKALEANVFYYFSEEDGVYGLVADAMDGNGWGYHYTSKLTPAGTVSGYISDGTTRLYAKDAKVIDLTKRGITDYDSLRRAVDTDAAGTGTNTVKVDVLLTEPGGDTAAVIYVYSAT